MHKNAHIKKEPVRIARTPRNHQKSATKCNIKKNGEQRANKEESAILQHDNTGVGADAPGIYKHDTRAADRDGLRAGDGNLCTRTGAEVFGDFGGLKRNLLTRQRAGSIPIFPTP